MIIMIVLVMVGCFFLFQQSNFIDSKSEDIVINEKLEIVNKENNYELGIKYYYGFEVEQNYEKAGEYFQKASVEGDSEAQYSLGAMYFTGGAEPQYYLLNEYAFGLTGNLKGIRKDYIKAEEWLKLSALNGNSEAYNNLGIMYYHGYGVEQDLQQAEDMFFAAINLDNRHALENLAYLYVYEGAIQSPKKAKIFVTKFIKEFMKADPFRMAELIIEIDEIFDEKVNFDQYSNIVSNDTLDLAQQLHIAQQRNRQRNLLSGFVNGTKQSYIVSKILSDQVNEEYKKMDAEKRKESINNSYRTKKKIQENRNSKF